MLSNQEYIDQMYEKPRHLIWHPESECLFEVQGRRALQQCLAEGCNQVTGMQLYEQRFRENQSKEKTMPRKTFTKRSQGYYQEQAAPVTDQPLHVKYRPTKLSEVIGHGAVVKSLEALLSKPTRPHTFLFTGTAGIGKTTLARILATEFQCDADNIMEVDAAVATGVDDMRSLIESIGYQGFGEHPNKMYIIDECHMLSKQAWGSLLKATEEPPQHVFFVFCTTEEGKVPDTMVTRCQTFNLKPLRNDDLMDLLEDVVTNELNSKPDEILYDIMKLVAKACNGSPRQALTMLANVIACQDINEAAALLEAPMENKEIIDLCRALVAGGGLDWKGVQNIIKSLSDQNPESVRIVIVNYLNSCLLNAKSDRDVPYLLDLLASFSKPLVPSDKWAGILLAIGNAVFPV